MARKKIGKTFWVLITVIPIIGLLFSLTDPKEFERVQELWRNRIVFLGVAGPLFFIFLQIAQVVFTPISHYTVGAIGGFIYGPFLGGFLNWTGRVIGHTIAYFLSKHFGRRFVEKYVEEKTVKQFDHFVAGEKYFSTPSLILFLIYFLPLFPDDEISYIVGLSRMKYKPFLLANLFGHVGGALSLAYIGSGIDTRDPYFWALFIATLAGFPIIWFLMKRQAARRELK